MIPFGEFAPDQPALDAGGQFSTVAKNVIPRTKHSYAPLGTLAALTGAITNTCQGAAAFRDSSGNVNSFAGDTSKLYKLSSTTYNDVTGSTTPSVADDDTWQFAKFGERIIAVSGHNTNTQSYVMESSTVFADLDSDAPRARHAAQIKDFIMLGNTYDSTDGSVANRIHWSAINDPTDWPTIGSADAASKQSDRQDLPSGGWVQAITGAVGGTDGVIFMDDAVYRVVYSGPPAVMEFYEVERARGTIASRSVVNIGDSCFYLANDGFYQFNGQDSIPIGDQKVDKTFFSRFQQDYPHLVWGASDPINKVVMWTYPSSSTSNATKALLYNWSLNEWSEAEFNSQVLFTDLTQGYTLEGLDAVESQIEDLPYSLDSRIWTGGKDVLAVFDTDKKNATFSGVNLAATIESQEIGGGERVLVDGIRPYVDVSNTAHVTVALKTRDDVGTSITTGSASSIDADGQAHFTTSSRYARAQVNIAASSTWTHAQGVDADITADGSA
jgi:hypothetical protein